MNGFLEWLHTQGQTLGATASAVIGNRPQPARDTVIYTLVIIGLIWAVFKIIKLIKK